MDLGTNSKFVYFVWILEQTANLCILYGSWNKQQIT